MLTKSTTREPRSPGLDAVGSCLADIAHRLGAHCLVETEDGAVVAHALRGDDAPEPFVRSVLSRSIGPLVGPLRDRRTEGVLPGGPLLVAALGGWSGAVLTAPLVHGGRRLGWLWLLAPAEALAVGDVARAAAEVSDACASRVADDGDSPLLAALRGESPLPPGTVGDAQAAWVLTVSSDGAQGVAGLCAAIAAVSRCKAPVVADGEVAHVVVLTGGDVTEAAVRARADELVRATAQRLGCRVAAGLSSRCSPAEPLGLARAQAVAAISHRPAWGRCTSVSEARSDIVLGLLSPALDALPDLGRDPVAALLERDSRRASDLAANLLVWLDLHGDTPCAAEQLGVHPNTLRYRIQVAREALGVDLDDPAVRLEVHLRLRAVPGLTRPDSR